MGGAVAGGEQWRQREEQAHVQQANHVEQVQEQEQETGKEQEKEEQELDTATPEPPTGPNQKAPDGTNPPAKRKCTDKHSSPADCRRFTQPLGDVVDVVPTTVPQEQQEQPPVSPLPPPLPNSNLLPPPLPGQLDPTPMQHSEWSLSEDDACCLHSVLTAALCEQVLNWATAMNRNNRQAWLPISEARQLDIPAGSMCDQIMAQLNHHDGLRQQILRAFPTADGFKIRDLKVLRSSTTDTHHEQVLHADCLTSDGAFGIAHVMPTSESTMFLPRKSRQGNLQAPRGVVSCRICDHYCVPTLEQWQKCCQNTHTNFECGRCAQPEEPQCVTNHALCPQAPTVCNMCRAELHKKVWSNYMDIFQEILETEEVRGFQHTSGTRGDGFVNAGTVSLIKLDAIHKGPGPRTHFGRMASIRYVVFFSVVPSCSCVEPQRANCHWQAVSARIDNESYDPAAQVHPSLLCSEGARWIDADKYWGLFQHLDSQTHKGKKMRDHMQDEDHHLFEDWLKKNKDATAGLAIVPTVSAQGEAGSRSSQLSPIGGSLKRKASSSASPAKLRQQESSLELAASHQQPSTAPVAPAAAHNPTTGTPPQQCPYQPSLTGLPVGYWTSVYCHQTLEESALAAALGSQSPPPPDAEFWLKIAYALYTGPKLGLWQTPSRTNLCAYYCVAAATQQINKDSTTSAQHKAAQLIQQTVKEYIQSSTSAVDAQPLPDSQEAVCIDTCLFDGHNGRRADFCTSLVGLVDNAPPGHGIGVPSRGVVDKQLWAQFLTEMFGTRGLEVHCLVFVAVCLRLRIHLYTWVGESLISWRPMGCTLGPRVTEVYMLQHQEHYTFLTPLVWSDSPMQVATHCSLHRPN